MTRAPIPLSCTDIADTIDRLTAVGFRVDTIFPADDPTTAVLSGHGFSIRLRRITKPAYDDEEETQNKATYDDDEETHDHPASKKSPPRAPVVPSFLVTHVDERAWHVGRAGMHYRDLVPDRRGGKVIASHIRIPEGGLVKDYVHFHEVEFQMIYCYKGWVRLVYEEQGPPFVMTAGDCVVQPPGIRHRVLECSPGLEVVEIGSPAMHPTHADHDLALPTPTRRLDRSWDGQRFLWDRAGEEAFGARTTMVTRATNGVAGVRVHDTATGSFAHRSELFFGFVLRGAMTLSSTTESARLGAGDAFVLPPERPFTIGDGTLALSWLEVTMPAPDP